MKKYLRIFCLLLCMCLFGNAYATTKQHKKYYHKHHHSHYHKHYKHYKKRKYHKKKHYRKKYHHKKRYKKKKHYKKRHHKYKYHKRHHVRYKKHSHVVAPTKNNTEDPINYVANAALIKRQPRLYSYAALAVNPKTGEIFVSKNANVKLSIASITKLMTAMVVLDAHNNLNSKVAISAADIDHLKNTYSRLRVGRKFTRKDLLLVALMSSENRAAHALARTSYRGGTRVFIRKMNEKAKSLGMTHTQFFDPTGLTKRNKSTATDLAKLVRAAFKYPLIRKDTTTKGYDFMLNRRVSHHYVNSDALVRYDRIPIGLSKTGFINEAGHCLVLYSTVNHKPIIMVFLNSTGKNGRLLDAIAVRRFVAAHD